MIKKLFKKLNVNSKKDFSELVKQFIKFGLVGISNTLIALVIYYILVCFNFNYILAHIIAFIISVLNAYYWNAKYVFKVQKESNKYARLIKVYLSYGITFLLSTGLLYLMVDIMQVSEYIAPLINLCITIPLNFILNKLWAFK